MIIGIFNLSGATDEADNHMVGINNIPSKNGIFNAKDIVASSAGDHGRLENEKMKKEYSVDNLKEIRVIFLSGCNIEE